MSAQYRLMSFLPGLLHAFSPESDTFKAIMRFFDNKFERTFFAEKSST